MLPWQQSMGVVLSSVECRCLWCWYGLQFKGKQKQVQHVPPPYFICKAKAVLRLVNIASLLNFFYLWVCYHLTKFVKQNCYLGFVLLAHGSLVCVFLQHEPERGAEAVRQECRSPHQGRAVTSVSEADEEGRYLAC